MWTSSVVICVDSLHTINQVEGHCQANKNADLIEEGRKALARVRERRTVTFVHMLRHSGDEGND